MRSPRLLRLAALVEVLAPVAAAVALVFGGGTVSSCLGGMSCAQRVVVVPPIRTSEGMAVSLAVCGLAWLAANYVILGHLARVDRRRLVRLAVGIGLATILMAAIGFVRGLEFRLLYAAQDAVTWGLAGLVITWIIGVTWAGLSTVRVPTPRSTGRP